MNLKILISMVLSFLFSGCIYPVYRTLQPELKIEFVDTGNSPVKDVIVHLGRVTYFEGGSFKEKIFKSNEIGIVEVDSIQKWGTDMLVPHGMTVFRWSLCIEKEGFLTVKTAWDIKESFQNKQKFILKKGHSTLCRMKN